MTPTRHLCESRVVVLVVHEVAGEGVGPRHEVVPTQRVGHAVRISEPAAATARARPYKRVRVEWSVCGGAYEIASIELGATAAATTSMTDIANPTRHQDCGPGASHTTTSHHITSHRTTQQHITSHNIKSHLRARRRVDRSEVGHIARRITSPHHSISHHITLHRITKQHITSQHITSHHPTHTCGSVSMYTTVL